MNHDSFKYMICAHRIIVSLSLFPSILALTRSTIAIIVGAIIGGVLIVILGLLLCYCYCKPAKKDVVQETVPSPMVADENLENATRGVVGTI
jgi:hypothetical protein